jgi:ADP-ribosylglycohydrolase
MFTMMKKIAPNETRKRRLRNALWGLFIGDALAMPAHWYYDTNNITSVFDGGIRRFEDPPHPHVESFMVGMGYHPDVRTAESLGRAYDILHEHGRFYNTSFSELQISMAERENQHGNPVAGLDERFHYHHGLKSGDNTLAAHLVRVLMRSVIRLGRYDPRGFIEDFIVHLTTPGKNRDPYTEIYIRRWFENYSRGLPAHACAEIQRNVWSIGSHGGIIRPLVISTIAASAYQGLGLAIEHQNLTHRSENAAAALGVLVPLFGALLSGAAPRHALEAYARSGRVPRITGEKLFATYREHNGPGNIPGPQMWQIHTDLVDTPFEIESLTRKNSNREVVYRMLSTACYPEHGLPLLLYLAELNKLDIRASLLANANAGGDNVHRGMVLGLIVGAANDELPDDLQQGLSDFADLQSEIDAFCDVVLSGRAI